MSGLGGCGGPRGELGSDSPRVGNASLSRARIDPRSGWSCHVSRVSGSKQRGLVSPGDPFPLRVSRSATTPLPPPSAGGRDGRSFNSLGAGSGQAGPVSWAGWGCYPAERPGGLEHGLWEGGWRPLEVGRPPQSDGALPPPTRSGAASILLVSVALEPVGYCEIVGLGCGHRCLLCLLEAASLG